MLNSTYGFIPDKKVVILIPSLRPHKWREIEQNIEHTTPNAKVLFLGEEYSNYAEAINAGYRETHEPFLFAGADDLVWTDGWLETALEKMKDGIKVVGTNDLGNAEVMAGEHATHYLVSRDYLDERGGVYDEGPGSFLPEVYDHNWTDREFIEVAKLRGVFAPCLESVVEHMHVSFGKMPSDEVYERSRRMVDEDKEIYFERLAEIHDLQKEDLL